MSSEIDARVTTMSMINWQGVSETKKLTAPSVSTEMYPC